MKAITFIALAVGTLSGYAAFTDIRLIWAWIVWGMSAAVLALVALVMISNYTKANSRRRRNNRRPVPVQETVEEGSD